MKKNSIILVVVLLIIGVFLALDSVYHFTDPQARAVDDLIARNVAARGGADAWHAVSSLQLSGQMDLGQGMHVPYVIQQKRPGKMCLEFVFDDQTAIQCVDGKSGWKLLPFRGQRAPETMTEAEYNEMADTADIDGLLFDSDKRGHKIELLGKESLDGRTALKLQVTLPSGGVRWVYIDEETALEIKLEAMRKISGKERRVETFYRDWQPVEGLLIAHRQDTRTEGDKESRFLTVDSVNVNPPIDNKRFAIPRSARVATTPGKAP